MKRKLKICFIHGPGHSSGEFKVLGDFGDEYAEIKPTKDHGNHPIQRGENKQLENNVIINNVVDEILLNKTQKVSTMRESPDCLSSSCDDKNAYHVDYK